MDCDTIRVAISTQIDGEVPWLPADVLETHLAGCPGCRDWQRRAHTVTRRVRLGGAFLDHDLAPGVLAAVPAARDRGRLRLARRGLLTALALAQFAIAAPMLFLGHDREAGVHAAHELGSFNLALAIAFAVGAIRPRLSAGLAWPCAIAAGGLVTTAIIDLIGGQAIGADEARTWSPWPGRRCWSGRRSSPGPRRPRPRSSRPRAGGSAGRRRRGGPGRASTARQTIRGAATPPGQPVRRLPPRSGRRPAPRQARPPTRAGPPSGPRPRGRVRRGRRVTPTRRSPTRRPCRGRARRVTDRRPGGGARRRARSAARGGHARRRAGDRGHDLRGLRGAGREEAGQAGRRKGVGELRDRDRAGHRAGRAGGRRAHRGGRQGRVYGDRARPRSRRPPTRTGPLANPTPSTPRTSSAG